MKYFPIFLDVAERRVAVVGGGAIAEAKLRLLLKTRALIDVYAETASETVERWASEERLQLHRRLPEIDDVADVVLLYAATDDAALSRALRALATQARVPMNAVDQPQQSDFITPAIVDRDPVVVAIGTEGQAPMLGRMIRSRVEALLPGSLGRLARLGGALRRTLPKLASVDEQRRRWQQALERSLDGSLLYAGSDQQITERLQQALLTDSATEDVHPGHDGRGCVDFVGAGPGDPDLLTVRALQALENADVIIHDRLVSEAILDRARREALRIDVGKQGFGPSTNQEAINCLIIEHAGQGLRVLRLKCGDPAIFGRLDEEIDACESAGVCWRIVPGITAAAAAAADLGCSLTRRDRNSALAVLTGHDCRGFSEQDWQRLATPGAVAAIYMGKRAARWIQGRLLMHGALAETPVTVVENAGRPEVRVIESSLLRLADDLAGAALSGPAVILYGLAARRAVQAPVDESLAQSGLAAT